MSRDEALATAQQEGMDLVEVAKNADPPVCRIMDYGKFKYKQKKRTHQAGRKHHAAHLKEIRVRPKTEEHDIQIKIRKAREFIGRRDKVLVNMLFRGRERSHVELGKAIMEEFAVALEDVAKIEKEAKLEGSRMGMILVPK